MIELCGVTNDPPLNVLSGDSYELTVRDPNTLRKLFTTTRHFSNDVMIKNGRVVATILVNDEKDPQERILELEATNKQLQRFTNALFDLARECGQSDVSSESPFSFIKSYIEKLKDERLHDSQSRNGRLDETVQENSKG
jgi:hypothetical protein